MVGLALRWACVSALAFVAACATAGYESGDDDDDTIVVVDSGPGAPDAATQPRPDASTGGTPDASTGAPVEITMSQSTAMSITELNTVACILSDSLTGEPLYHRQNSYYRAFALSSYGVSGAFTVSKVTLGVESASALSGGSQSASVVLHTVSGAFPAGTLTLVGSQAFNVPDTATSTLIEVPMSAVVPAGSTMVVEISIPDGEITADAPGNILFLGSNDLGETGPTYLKAADCGVTAPQTSAELGFATMQLVLAVTGTHVP